MTKRLTSFFELVLLMVVVISLGLGVGWAGNLTATSSQPESIPPVVAQAKEPQQPTAAPTTAVQATAPIQAATETVEIPLTATVGAQDYIPLTGTIGPLATSVVFSNPVAAEPGDAPLLVQAPGTMNILLLGVDASADERLSRTDSILIASVNPDMPSVSMLSIARDTQVRIPGHPDDRINTVFELGYLNHYPGGGPAFLGAVLRKNFGIKIDHYVRIDFNGFKKAVDTLGGVDVLAECELHDTFPDKTAPNGRVDLDVYPGRISLNGQQALMFARSRWSTSDFDRARRQQKVLRSILSKAKSTNILANALGLYQDFTQYVETDIGLTSIPAFVDIAQRLNDLAIKSRVVTFPIVKPVTRKDGAMVLMPTADIIPYIAEALSPPAGNRVQSRPGVEVYNASGRKDMEAVAAERLNWEGFAVITSTVLDTTQAKTQIVNFSVTPKGSPIPRLITVFNVAKSNVLPQADPGSTAVARIVLGADYDSCPRTASIAGDVQLAPSTELIPTSTPQR